jgi:allantoin racemase
MKIMVIAPGQFSSEEIEVRKKYLESYASPNTEIEVVPVKKGPVSTNSPDDFLLLVPGILERVIEAEENKFDAVLIHCFGDPGRDLARSKVNIPVVGAYETTFHTACMLAKKFGIVGRADYQVTTLRKLFSTVPGVAERIVSFKAISPAIPILELNKRKDELRKKFVILAEEAIEKDGAELIIGACLAIFPTLGKGSREKIEKELGVPVLDGAAIGFKTAELWASLGLKHSNLAFR